MRSGVQSLPLRWQYASRILSQQPQRIPTNHDRHIKYRALTTVSTTTTIPPPPPPPGLFDSSAKSAVSTTKPIAPPIQRAPSTQPPSHRPPEARKSQLHRGYTSLLRSTPLMLVLQHNNLKASEWAGIRRELNTALRKTAAATGAEAASKVRIQVINTGLFSTALRVIEHYLPKVDAEKTTAAHLLSREAWLTTRWPRRNEPVQRRKRTTLDPLLRGPCAVVTFENVAPHQLASALSVLSPAPPAFPAPKRREAPGYYEPAVQAGLEKLLLLGARVEGKAMDQEGIKWVGGLAARGGIEGLRAEVVGLLQGAGMGLVGTLQGASTSLWATMEGRRRDLEGDAKEGEKGA